MVALSGRFLPLEDRESVFALTLCSRTRRESSFNSTITCPPTRYCWGFWTYNLFVGPGSKTSFFS